MSAALIILFLTVWAAACSSFWPMYEGCGRFLFVSPPSTPRAHSAARVVVLVGGIFLEIGEDSQRNFAAAGLIMKAPFLPSSGELRAVEREVFSHLCFFSPWKFALPPRGQLVKANPRRPETAAEISDCDPALTRSSSLRLGKMQMFLFFLLKS